MCRRGARSLPLLPSFTACSSTTHPYPPPHSPLKDLSNRPPITHNPHNPTYAHHLHQLLMPTQQHAHRLPASASLADIPRLDLTESTHARGLRTHPTRCLSTRRDRL